MSNITLRDHFAGLAMLGFLGAVTRTSWDEIECAIYAYEQADAMIAERNKYKERHQELWEEL